LSLLVAGGLLSDPSAAIAQSVGAAGSFAILGGSSATAAGTGSVINGDVGKPVVPTLTGISAREDALRRTSRSMGTADSGS